jgi:hypothetical protein
MSEKSLTELATAIRRQAEHLAQEQPGVAQVQGTPADLPVGAREDLARQVAEVVAAELSRSLDTASDVDWQPIVQLTAELKTLVAILQRHEENLPQRLFNGVLDAVEEDMGPRLDRIDARLRGLVAGPSERPRHRGGIVLAVVLIIAAFVAGIAAAPLLRPHLDAAVAMASGLITPEAPQ